MVVWTFSVKHYPCVTRKWVDGRTCILREGHWSCLDTTGPGVCPEAIFLPGQVPTGQL